jgi:signal peptidase II
MQESINPRNLNNFKTRIALFIALVGLGFLLDRVLKYIIEIKLPTEEFFIVPRILDISLHQNQGMAFGLNVPMWLIVLLGLIILSLLGFSVIFSLKTKRADWFYPMTLIFTGGLSNLADRILFGYTIDYFYLHPYSFFNLADLMILAGCIIAITHYWRNKKHGK